MVDATDGSEELCRIAREYTGIDVRQMLFEELSEVGKYDGIWACSSILHLSKKALKDVFYRMGIALKDNGVVYTSFKYGDFEGPRNGRYFTDFTVESFTEYLNDIPEFMIEEYWITGDVRPGRSDEKWLNLILRKKGIGMNMDITRNVSEQTVSELKKIIEKFNKGYMTEEEKQSGINSLLAAESAQIWDRLMNEYEAKETVAEPGMTFIHSWHNCIAINVAFKCVNDGGLLQDENPKGKVFRLQREDGVSAKLKVTARYDKSQGEYVDVLGRQAPCNNQDIILGQGEIDDYYFSNPEPQRSNFEIRIGDNGIQDILFYGFYGQEKMAYSIDFPRWQPYIAKMKSVKAAHEIEMQKLVEFLTDEHSDGV